MINMLNEFDMETWPIVRISPKNFEYLVKKHLATRQKTWPGQEVKPNITFLGFNKDALIRYAWASDEYIKRYLQFEESLVDASPKNENRSETAIHPDKLCRCLKYTPHTRETYASSDVKRLMDSQGRTIGVSYIMDNGLGITNGKTIGSGDRFCTWEELFTTATTPNGQPFGQLVSDVINKATTPTPQDPTPTDPTEPDFL